MTLPFILFFENNGCNSIEIDQLIVC